MIEIACSNDDLASTPSNRSEYFSVDSSLNILDSNEEIYHSFDEEIEPQITCESVKFYNRRVQQCKIVKQDHLEIDLEENVCILSMSIETIPESKTCRNSSAECELWDKCSPPLRVVKSQESINTFEDDIINSSIYSNSQIKESSISEDDNINNSSDNEESISINQLNTSQIEGELSDINDIIYDSSISPVNAANPVISEENDSSQVDINIVDEIQNSTDNITLLEPLEIDNDLPIFEIVKQLEKNIQLQCEQITITLAANEPETLLPVEKDNDNCVNPVECPIQVTDEPLLPHNSRRNSSRNRIDTADESPVKRSYLCCAVRKTKKRTESPKSKPIQKSKAKRFFSFFKKPATMEKKPDKEVVVEQNNVVSYKCQNSTFVNSIDYDGIPFIDADVTIDTEDYVSLAKQELFSD